MMVSNMDFRFSEIGSEVKVITKRELDKWSEHHWLTAISALHTHVPELNQGKFDIYTLYF